MYVLHFKNIKPKDNVLMIANRYLKLTMLHFLLIFLLNAIAKIVEWVKITTY
jgi:hypothetical protein